jgi:hypothetical protein
MAGIPLSVIERAKKKSYEFSEKLHYLSTQIKLN